MKQVLIVIAALVMLPGCYYGHMDFKSGTLTRFALFYDAEFSAARYNPETGLIELEGYKSDTSHAIELANKALGMVP